MSQWRRVARKEAAAGLLNGAAIALAAGLGAFLWSGSLGLGVVVGASMILSMTVAGLAGTLIPISLQALGQDPAQSSSIVLTTVTDVVGFLSFLGLATLLSRFIRRRARLPAAAAARTRGAGKKPRRSRVTMSPTAPAMGVPQMASG